MRLLPHHEYVYLDGDVPHVVLVDYKQPQKSPWRWAIHHLDSDESTPPERVDASWPPNWEAHCHGDSYGWTPAVDCGSLPGRKQRKKKQHNLYNSFFFNQKCSNVRRFFKQMGAEPHWIQPARWDQTRTFQHLQASRRAFCRLSSEGGFAAWWKRFAAIWRMVTAWRGQSQPHIKLITHESSEYVKTGRLPFEKLKCFPYWFSVCIVIALNLFSNPTLDICDVLAFNAETSPKVDLINLTKKIEGL